MPGAPLRSETRTASALLAPGPPAAARPERVRVGPFANRSDALSMLHELTARGYAPFIAEIRN